MYCHFMVPVDASMVSAANIEAATELAARLGARITFFYAAPDLAATEDGALLLAVNPTVFNQIVPEDTDVLSKAAAVAATAGVPCETMSRVCDRPAEVIVQVAQEHECDLIVMASRGARGLTSWMHASQTERVFRQSPVALLITRVATNDPLSPEERALAIIQDEHRSIAAVLRGMQELIAPGADESDAALDLTGLEAMLVYLQEFPVRLHHPKEEQLLHPKLRTRTAECEELLCKLEAQHVEEGVLILDALARLDAAKLDPVAERADLATSIRTLCEAVSEHIRLEETLVLPMARQCLLTEDWLELASAFESNDAPDFGQLTTNEFRRIFARITNLLPRSKF